MAPAKETCEQPVELAAAIAAPQSDRIWIAVFIFSFLGVLIDGIDMMFLAVALPKLMVDLHLNKIEAGTLGTISMIGMAIGGVFGGWTADRYGRVRTMVWCMVLFSVGTSALGFTQNYWQFGLIRFISSLGMGAAWGVCMTLVGEFVPTKHRGIVLGVVGAGYSIGYALSSLLAGWIIPIYGWRTLFFCSLAPVALAIMMQRMIPEPPGWKERVQASADNHEKGNAEWHLIFGEPATRRNFMLWTTVCTFLQFGYYGASNWLPSYLVTETGMDFRKMTGFMVGTFMAAVVGKIVAGYLADKVGRRILFVLPCLGTAIALPVIIFYHSPENIVILMTIFGFLYGAPYGVNGSYMAESFNVRIRATAVSGSYNVGRIGAALAPAVIGGIATQSSIGMGLTILAVSYVLTVLPTFFIPDHQYDCQAK
jgi:AAHS family cis,cis-muconate transporter-like MFS transporter